MVDCVLSGKYHNKNHFSTNQIKIQGEDDRDRERV